GDEVTVLPSGFTSKIKSINKEEEDVEEAYAPMSVAMTLEDDFDISRGDMIVKTGNQPEAEQEFDVMLCWLNNKPAQARAKYTLKHTTNEQLGLIKAVKYKIDINTYDRITDE